MIPMFLRVPKKVSYLGKRKSKRIRSTILGVPRTWVGTPPTKMEKGAPSEKYLVALSHPLSLLAFLVFRGHVHLTN